jgi:hypothetical protein
MHVNIVISTLLANWSNMGMWVWSSMHRERNNNALGDITSNTHMDWLATWPLSMRKQSPVFAFGGLVATCSTGQHVRAEPSQPP